MLRRNIKHKTSLFYHILRTLFHLITWVIPFKNTLIPYQQAWQGQTTICAKIGLHPYFYTHQIPFISKQGTAQRQNEYYGFILQEMAYSLYLTYPVIWLFFYNTIEKIQSWSSSCLSWHIQNVTFFEGDGVFVQQTGRASCGVSIEQCAQWCRLEYLQFFLTIEFEKL